MAGLLPAELSDHGDGPQGRGYSVRCLPLDIEIVNLARALLDKNRFFSASAWADRPNVPLTRRDLPKKSAIGLRCYLRAVDKPLDSIAKRGGELDHLLRTRQHRIDFIASVCDGICDARLRLGVSATRIVAARAPTRVFSGQQQFSIGGEPVRRVFLRLGSFQEQLAYSRRD